MSRTTIEIVAPDAPLPNLPVARATWKPAPSLATSAECWITAGGPHHTVLTTAVERDTLEDFATIAGVELAWIDGTNNDRGFTPRLKWNRRTTGRRRAMSATQTPRSRSGSTTAPLSGRVLVLDLLDGAELAAVDVPYCTA